MKKYIYMSMALAATMFAACSSDDALDNIENEIADNNNEQPITIVANLPQNTGTRVSYTDNSEGTNYSLTPAWATGDKVRYCYKSGNEKKRTVEVSILDGIATFTLSDGDPDASSYIYCHHPAGANYFTSLADNTSTCDVMPPSNVAIICNSTSELSSKNFLIGSLQYSGSKKNLKMEFKNIYALMKFTIKVPYEDSGEYKVSRFSSVTIKGYDGTKATTVKVGGTVTVTGSTGEFAWSGETDGEYARTANIDLTNNGTTEIVDGYRTCTLYVLVTPQTWNGLYMSAKDNGSTAHTYVYAKAGNIELEAGKMYGINITLKKAMIQ